MNRRLAAAVLPLATVSILTTGAAGGCGSPSSGPAPGNTVVVPGATNEAVTCNEEPYDSTSYSVDASGSGISVTHGLVRGSLWVTCTDPGPDSFSIIVILVRDGQELEPGSHYTGIPNTSGYEAYTFTNCVPGSYHLYYRYRWTLQAGVQQNSKTVTADRVVTQHDCDS